MAEVYLHVYSAEQKEKTKEEDGARDLSRPETILDYADAVLAVGERRRGYQNWRTAVDRVVQTRARRADGVVE